jgi:uncharacterized protein with FMN-binding domain
MFNESVKVINMKKYLLSLLVVSGFIVYSLNQKNKTEGLTTVDAGTILPKNKNGDISVTPSSTFGDKKIELTLKPTSYLASMSSTYIDGQYEGSLSDAYYGYVKVKVIITGGKITDIIFLDYPSDREHSISINKYAMPILKNEALKIQNFKVDSVTGATDTSFAFKESLASALQKASK